MLDDLGSSGGTMVNGSRISGPVFLVGGERIQMGANALELVVAAAPVAVAPPDPPHPRLGRGAG